MPSFNRWENWGPERGSPLCRTPQEVSGRGRTKRLVSAPAVTSGVWAVDRGLPRSPWFSKCLAEDLSCRMLPEATQLPSAASFWALQSCQLKTSSPTVLSRRGSGHGQFLFWEQDVAFLPQPASVHLTGAPHVQHRVWGECCMDGWVKKWRREGMNGTGGWLREIKHARWLHQTLAPNYLRQVT